MKAKNWTRGIAEPLRRYGPRTAIVFFGLAALLVLDHLTLHLVEGLRAWINGLGPGDRLIALLGATFAYAVLLSLPFVPGLELGLMLMAVFGVTGIAVAYAGTVLGLSMGFAFGRWLRDASRDTRDGSRVLRRCAAAALIAGRLHRTRTLPRIIGALKRHPALMLAGLLNLPGNTVLGGGGGISLLYGLSCALSWPAFVLTVAIATAPVPVLFLLGWSAA